MSLARVQSMSQPSLFASELGNSSQAGVLLLQAGIYGRFFASCKLRRAFNHRRSDLHLPLISRAASQALSMPRRTLQSLVMRLINHDKLRNNLSVILSAPKSTSSDIEPAAELIEPFSSLSVIVCAPKNTFTDREPESAPANPSTCSLSQSALLGTHPVIPSLNQRL